MSITPALRTERLTLRLPSPAEAGRVAGFFDENLDHLRPFQPTLPEGYTSEVFWRPALEHAQASRSDIRWFVYDEGESPIGYVSLTSLKGGHEQSAELSYAIDHRRVGQGLMSEAVRAAIEHAAAMGLHRIDAKYRADNARSGTLLHRLGFVTIGIAPAYAWIDGAWRDHVLTMRLLEGRTPTRASWAIGP